MSSARYTRDDPRAELEPYAPDERAPWNRARVVHLHQRAGFGATWDEVEQDLAQGPAAALARLLGGARTAAVPAEAGEIPPRAERAAIDGHSIERLEASWVWRMLFGPDPLGERLTLLWHDHFATSFDKVADVRAMQRQNALLRECARAPFGTLLRRCVKDEAMLLWLDAHANNAAHPNENLARELMELFTLGEGNYTETDVRESARALAGWRVTATGEFYVLAEHQDRGEKTILGRHGTLDGDDLLGILLAHPATPRRLARRIAGWLLVAELVSDELVAELAAGLAASELDVGRCVRRLLGSRLFFRAENLRRQVAPPAPFVVGAARAFEFFAPPADSRALAEWCATLGQHLFHPPSVFGWPSGEGWITTRSMLARGRFARALSEGRLAANDDEGPVRRLFARHGIGSAPAERVDFCAQLWLGGAPPAELRETLLALAGADDARAPERMVAGLLTAPEGQLS